MIEFLTFGTAFLAAYLGIFLFRAWSTHRGLFDIPNERSSHDEPTPRGGGLVIVLICLIAYAILGWFYPSAFSWSYFVSALMIGLVSWLDDIYTVSFYIRLAVHSLAAALMITELGYWQTIYIPLLGEHLSLGYAGAALTFAWIVWMVNAYNFMDGIDGIAGVQAVLASCGWMLFCFILGVPSTFIFCGVILFASAGFLMHNWHPATVFMGDVGSAFLGFTFAVIPLLIQAQVAAELSFLPVVAAMFVWLFLFDTVLTFARRLLKGKKVWHPHREHLYQRLVISGLRHDLVTGFYGLLTAIIIFSVVYAISNSGILEPLLLLIIGFLTAVLITLAFVRRALT